MEHSSITRNDRLAYIDFFKQARELAIRSPFHFLLFDEALSPVLQALTINEILCIHPIDAAHKIRVWSCEDVCEILKVKQNLWQKRTDCGRSPNRPGTVMLVVPRLNGEGQRNAGTWETVLCQEER